MVINEIRFCIEPIESGALDSSDAYLRPFCVVAVYQELERKARDCRPLF